MDMLQQLGQGVKKVGTGLESFVTGAQQLDEIKKQNTGVNELMSRLGGFTGGLMGMIPGANAPQGRSPAFYGLKTLGESFALPAQNFVALQASRAPQLQRGASGELLQYNPQSGATRTVRQAPAKPITPQSLLSEALEMERQGIADENMPEQHRRVLRAHRAELAPEPSLGPSPSDLLRQALALEAADVPREQWPPGAAREYDAHLRNLRPAAGVGRSPEDLLRQGIELEAGQVPKEQWPEEIRREHDKYVAAFAEQPERWTSLSQAFARAIQEGNKPVQDKVLAAMAARAEATRAPEEPDRFRQALSVDSQRIYDRVRSRPATGGSTVMGAFINANPEGSVAVALDQALLDREYPSMLFRDNPRGFRDRNFEAWTLLSQARLLDERDGLRPDITWDNRAAVLAKLAPKPIPQTQIPMTIDAVTRAQGSIYPPEAATSPAVRRMTDEEVIKEIQRRRAERGY